MNKYLITPLLIIIIFIFQLSCDKNTVAIKPPVNIDTIQNNNTDTIINIIDTTTIEEEPEIEEPKIEESEPIIIKTVREKLMDSINAQLYVREITSNRAPMIDIYLRVVNSQVGVAWCAAFVGANLTWQGVPNPNSAWSPSYAASKDIIWKPRNYKNDTELLPGDVVTFFYTNLNRVGHVGFYEKKDDFGYFITIEGNTNGAGSREGDGVYRKKRDPNKIHAVSRYIFY